MPGWLSSGEREYATLVAQLRALEEDIDAARRGGLPVPTVHRAPPPLHGERVRLPDGAEIVVRPIEPDDFHDIAVGFSRLGALSRFRLFHERVAHLTRAQLVALTHPDHDSHEVLVALDAATGDAVGIARYVRAHDDPTRADVTCTVVDQWQHRGVGSALAEHLAARARAAGIERCTAEVVLGDEPARHLLAHVADDIIERRNGGTVDITARARRPSP
ncbi:MAG TPA: GNAT family N-acetyltransferase [Solirubrobacteraceae bacterium]|nr:GNAT family N-acetyltransferase [Solirubrobacteraceae bacterium]